jgi:micrococcal nuclease
MKWWLHTKRRFALVSMLSAFLGLLVTTAGLCQRPVILRGKVVGISDGDTVKVLVANQHLIRVRIAFLDSPEKHQAFGDRARRAMSELIFSREVELRPHAIDRYGRLVAQVFVNGADAGLEMIRQGYAWCYERYLPEAGPDIQTSYRRAQDEARAKRLGLWSDPNPLEPWLFRRTGLKSANRNPGPRRRFPREQSFEFPDHVVKASTVNLHCFWMSRICTSTDSSDLGLDHCNNPSARSIALFNAWNA